MPPVKIRNYTSSVPADRSVTAIEKMLASVGARRISKEYGPTGEIARMTFSVMLNDVLLHFSLPVKVDAIFRVLLSKRKGRTTEPMKKDIFAQAERTAWKLMNDWVDIQCTMIATEQAEMVEIFFPYIMAKDGQTIYTKLKGSKFKELGGM